MTLIDPTAFVHETVVLGSNVVIGPGCKVWQYATLRDGVILGANVVVGSASWIGSDSRIGPGTRIQHGVFIPNGTIVGQRAFFGPNCTLTDDKNPRAGNADYRAEPPVVGDDVAIGAGSVILPGVQLEEGCVVGAGSVVTRRVPRFMTVIGSPAETIQDYKNKEMALRKIVSWVGGLVREWSKE